MVPGQLWQSLHTTPGTLNLLRNLDLPIICIQDPDVTDPEQKKRILEGNECWTEDGKYINSSDTVTGIDINGLNKEAGIALITKWLESEKLGISKVNYKIRDWLFSRQRYWGEPFPCNSLGRR